jgi:hypothetical protein
VGPGAACAASATAAEEQLAPRAPGWTRSASFPCGLERQDSAVERIARERFGMIREGELLYRFVPVDSAAKGTAGP